MSIGIKRIIGVVCLLGFVFLAGCQNGGTPPDTTMPETSGITAPPPGAAVATVFDGDGAELGSYESLEAAFIAVNEMRPKARAVTLNTDYRCEGELVPLQNYITFDINGKKLSLADGLSLQSSDGVLTIIDTPGTGLISGNRAGGLIVASGELYASKILVKNLHVIAGQEVFYTSNRTNYYGGEIQVHGGVYTSTQSSVFLIGSSTCNLRVFTGEFNSPEGVPVCNKIGYGTIFLDISSKVTDGVSTGETFMPYINDPVYNYALVTKK